MIKVNNARQGFLTSSFKEDNFYRHCLNSDPHLGVSLSLRVLRKGKFLLKVTHTVDESLGKFQIFLQTGEEVNQCLKAGAQGEVTFERGYRDAAEASGSQMCCAGTGVALVGQKGSPGKECLL
jgi:hypothetical protein